MRTRSPVPPGRADAAPWRRWLLPGIIAAFFVALYALPRGAAAGTPLTYTQFVADVGAGTVRAVTIGPAGQVTGSLTSGQPFTSTIPVALGGNGLAGDLAAHHVQVTAAAATSPPLLSALVGLLPLLLIGGLIYFVVRGARRQAGGLNGVTKAKARVIDGERPAARFTDVAGYSAVKTEISEVVDYLRDPGRYHRAGARGPRGVLMAGPPGTGKTQARDLLTCHRDALDRLTAALMEQETVSGDQVRALVQAPHPDPSPRPPHRRNNPRAK